LGFRFDNNNASPQKVQCSPHGEIRQAVLPARGGFGRQWLIETQIATKENKNKRKNNRILICDNWR